MSEREFVVATVGSGATEVEVALGRQITDIEFQAESIVINNDEDYKSAGEFGVLLKKKAAEVTAFFKPMKDSAYQAHRAICEREKSMLTPLKNAEASVKKVMSVYFQEQEKARRAAEEAARRAAEAERERLLNEAQELEKSGNVEEADAVLCDAVVMDNARFTSNVSKPEAKGVSTRKDWEIVSIDSDKVPIFVRGLEIRPVDKGALIKLIRAAKGNIRIDGVVFKEVSQMTFRR